MNSSCYSPIDSNTEQSSESVDSIGSASQFKYAGSVNDISSSESLVVPPPRVGQIFRSYNEADFYYAFAAYSGFSVRKGSN